MKLRIPYQVSPGQKFEEKSQCVPGQSYSLSELVERFTRGERLLVHQRPSEQLYQTDENGDFVDKSVQDETFENVLPIVEDPVDIEELESSTKEKKRTVLDRIKARMSKKSEEKSKKSEEKSKKSEEKSEKEEKNEEK